MKVKSEKRYDLTDLTFDQLEVISLAVERINGPDIRPDTQLIAEEIAKAISEELRND